MDGVRFTVEVERSIFTGTDEVLLTINGWAELAFDVTNTAHREAMAALASAFARALDSGAR